MKFYTAILCLYIVSQKVATFFTARAMLCAVYAMVVCLSVCVSVCPFVTKRHTTAQGLYFSDAKNLFEIRTGSPRFGHHRIILLGAKIQDVEIKNQ